PPSVHRAAQAARHRRGAGAGRAVRPRRPRGGGAGRRRHGGSADRDRRAAAGLHPPRQAAAPGAGAGRHAGGEVGAVSKVLGIDLGTTNSCASIMEAGSPQVIANREGSRTTSSIVAFTEDGERLVGQIAKRQAITNPLNTVFAVKRLVGRKYDSPETAHAREVLSYEIARAGNGDVKIRARGREYSPEEISAFILSEIKEFSEEALGEEITEAIITVPAYFDDAQRQAKRDAGRIAGLEVLRIIIEPKAASLAYGLDRKGSEVVAVYDLGG